VAPTLDLISSRKRIKLELTKRESLFTTVSLGITNSDNKLSGATAFAISGRQGNLEDGGLAVAFGRGRVGIAGDKGGEIDDSIGLVAERKSGAGYQAEDLRVSQDDVDGGVVCSEPAFVAVTFLAREQVVVVLELCEVLAHVIGGPRFIAGKGSNVVKV
jgi:hypothetical protein